MSSHALHSQHERSFETNRFVYPVLSRRSGGLSIGVNLNPDKVCNFDCIYCQVDRTVQSETRFVEFDALLGELDHMLGFVGSGQIWNTPKFRSAPATLRRLTDIAFSGDGEPTTYKNFDQIIEACAAVAKRRGLLAENAAWNEPSQTAEGRPAHRLDVKMVLITNASMFHRPHVQRGLAIFDEHHGEIWAKLDAGTEDYFQLIDRSPIPLCQILENITSAATIRPLVIQSLFMRVENAPPPPSEIDAFCDRLGEIRAGGGELKLVQVYTIARRPAESSVTSLADREVDAIARQVRQRTGLVTEVYYGVGDFA